MAIHRARTTTFIVQTLDYFVAHLDNGGVRVGFRGATCFDFPANHGLYAEALTLTAETVEEFHDQRMSEYCA